MSVSINLDIVSWWTLVTSNTHHPLSSSEPPSLPGWLIDSPQNISELDTNPNIESLGIPAFVSGQWRHGAEG